MITNTHTGTAVDEIEAGIYRIHTPIPAAPGGFSFNQYLVDDDEPLLFHTGPRKLSPLVREAIASVMPIERLRWIGFGHFEADECGGLNELLAAAPQATAMCSAIGAMVSGDDFADRPVRGLRDRETFSTGRRTFEWLSTPHLPHGWDAGVLLERDARTLFCGDLFTQPGTGNAALVETDILGPSEGFRGALDYYSHGKTLRPLIDAVAATEPRTLACMHGSAWRGDGGALLRTLGDHLAAPRGAAATPMMSITIGDRQLIVTSDQLFLTPDGTMITAARVVPGTLLVAADGTPVAVTAVAIAELHPPGLHHLG